MHPGPRLPLAAAATVLAVTLAATLAAPPSARAIAFRFPVLNEGGDAVWTAMIFGVDHDAEPGTSRTDCVNYAGLSFPFCYDDHGGSDFLLDGGFATMDAGSATIVAAADGVVVRVVDGNYDRCHGNLQTLDVSCDGHEMRSNQVTLEHAGGWRTGYHHMKSGSPMVREGDVVVCGQPLGLIGSSGYSTAPHLHFQVYDPDGNTVDPYAGPWSQPESYWVEQDGPYGLPAERCEGEEPPPPEDVVTPGPDATADVIGGDEDGGGEDGGAPDAGLAADAGAPRPEVTVRDDADEPGPGPGPGPGPFPEPVGDATAGGDGGAGAGRDGREGGDAGADAASVEDDARLTAGNPLGCAAAPPGPAPGTPGGLPLVVLLALLLLAGGRYARSPRSASVARSASARSRSRRTSAASE